MFAGPRVVRRRPLLRAAVVGGTSYAAGRAAGRRAGQADSAEAYQYQDQQAAPQQPPQGGSTESSMMDQLSQLATLHQQGALTDEEFAAAKAKLLAS
jgi:Short C-terminal domain